MSEQHSDKYISVFDTLPRCKGHTRSIRNGGFGKRKTRRVVKNASTSDKTIISEIQAGKSLSYIPNYKDYFILAEDVCTDDPNWEKSSIFKPGSKHIMPFVQLRMRYSGVKLSEYALNVQKLLANWVDIQIHLAEGLRILHSKNWVHGDLHFGNIVVDEKNIPRIIDFGLAYNLNTLDEKELLTMSFIPSYDNYAPELDYFAGIVGQIGSQREIIEQIYDRKHILKEIDEVFPSDKGVLNEMTEFSKRFDRSTVDFLKRWGKASDMWTFGFDFYKLYMLMLAIPYVISSNFYKLYHNDQMKILRGLLHVDPRRRSTVDDLLTELYSLRMAIQ